MVHEGISETSDRLDRLDRSLRARMDEGDQLVHQRITRLQLTNRVWLLITLMGMALAATTTGWWQQTRLQAAVLGEVRQSVELMRGILDNKTIADVMNLPTPVRRR